MGVGDHPQANNRMMRVRLVFMMFFLTCICICINISLGESATNKTDHLALLAFKGAISQDPNQVLSSWNNSLHFCLWGGVTCSKRHPQRVTALNLEGQSLVGYLSPHIANLSFLRSIHLPNNSFQGHIPHEIGHLSRLRYLRLYLNNFEGEIPKNLTHCLELKSIDLYENKLIGEIPFQLGSLLKLNRLALGKNNLVGEIPPSLANLSSLTYLFLSDNSLEGNIPDELGRLVSLSLLTLEENKLSGMIPSSLYNLSSITTLGVAGNHLHGSLPHDLGLNLPNLEILYVGQNGFSGPIPVSLINASRLLELDFSNNNFSGSMPMNLGWLHGLRWLSVSANLLEGGKDDDLNFITSLTNCSGLETLILSNNKFSGILPFSIANLSTQLIRLGLERNQISGTIPSEIENLVNLNWLSMFVNRITGTIPVHVGKLQKLEVLYLQHNRLSGHIPTSLGNLTSLLNLILDRNNLHGNIPWSLGNCKHLEAFTLSNNNLSGIIPKQLFSIPPLMAINLKMNSFTGSLPVEVGTLENLQLLDVSNNKLSGEIPSTLQSLIKLELLNMGENYFQGSIPPSLSALKGIEVLDLSHNNLSGHIPKDFEKFIFLQYLNLSFNNLEGEVPKSGIFQNMSAISIEGNIRLCGGNPKLQLPKCPKQDLKKKGRAVSLRAIIAGGSAVVLCLLLLAYFIVTRCWLKKSIEKPASIAFMRDPFPDVTYAELIKATDGFSSASLIGMGSFGSVYKGIIDRIETTVAIKVLKLQQRGAFKTFIAECEALRNIQHRNIVKILTVCSSIDFNGNDFKALVFEYMSNGSLDMWLHPNVNEQHHLRNLYLIQRINVAIDVAYALDYFHNHCQEPVVHCDLKPSNVLLDNDMVAHVSDFGLARILSKDVVNYSQTQSSSILIKGSIGYVAPEYGIGGDVSTYGDVYSYGIFLLEMFIGKRPTDNMFEDNLSLHQFAKTVLPERVMDIVDHRLLSDEIETIRQNENYSEMRSRMHDCLVSLLRIGVSCSTESPKERMDMRDVVKEMNEVKDLYLGVGKYQHNHNRASLSMKGPSYLSNY